MSEQGIKTPPASEQIGSQSEPTLRDQVSHAFSELKAKEPREGETPEAAAQRVRDAEGKFAKEPEGKKRETLTLPAKTEPTPIAAAPTPVAVKPPDGWNAAAKAKFDKLEPDIQAEILRRETDMHKQFTTQDNDRTLGKRIRESAAPYLATIKAEGGDESAAFGAFLNYAHIMRSGTPQQKLAALQTVAQQYNVPLGASLQQAPQNQMFESLQQRIERMEGERQAEIQQRQVQEQSALQNEVEAFAAEPGHEHYEKVRVKMGALLSNGEAKDLQDAYDQATWAHPEIRSTLTAAQLIAAESKRLTESQQITGAAKWAAGSVTGGPGGAKVLNGAGAERSLGEELRANFRAAQGRV